MTSEPLHVIFVLIKQGSSINQREEYRRKQQNKNGVYREIVGLGVDIMKVE